MAKAPLTPETADTAPDSTETGLRLATALCWILRDGRAYEPGDAVPVDPTAFAELRAFKAVEAGAFDALPEAAA